MTAVATIVYLTVSTTSLTVHTVAFTRIMTQSSSGIARQGLLRTSLCRVAASATYVGLAALSETSNTGMAALVALILIQLMWQANGVCDARLGRQLANNPKHARNGVPRRQHSPGSCSVSPRRESL